jgi:hypothetical protein
MVDIGTRLWTGWSGVVFSVGPRIFLFSMMSRLALGPRKLCYGVAPYKSLKYHSRGIYSFETYSCWSTRVMLKLQFVFYVPS